MELKLGIIGTLLIAVVGALLGRQAVDSAPSFARWLVNFGVRRLPEHLRERYREEWLRVIEDVPGPLLKVWTALGFVVSVRSLNDQHDSKLQENAQAPQLRIVHDVPGRGSSRRGASVVFVLRLAEVATTILITVTITVLGLVYVPEALRLIFG